MLGQCPADIVQKTGILKQTTVHTGFQRKRPREAQRDGSHRRGVCYDLPGSSRYGKKHLPLRWRGEMDFFRPEAHLFKILRLVHVHQHPLVGNSKVDGAFFSHFKKTLQPSFAGVIQDMGYKGGSDKGRMPPLPLKERVGNSPE
jgi:hypothetical protein